MGRAKRTTPGGYVYHVLNRANGRATLFRQDRDYAAFLRVLAEAQHECPLRLLAFCLMPNHWHLVVWPQGDDELSRFLHWLTLTHSQRWLAHDHCVGSGHVYQGRFKSFPVSSDAYYLTLPGRPGGYPARAPTDPDVQISRIRLVRSTVRLL
jgi:putative transposase